MICKACGTDKRDEDFPFTYKRKPDGDYRRDVSGKMPRSGVCKECKNKSCSEWRKNNRRHVNLRQRKYRIRNKFKLALIESRKISRRKGYLPCNASETEIEAAYSGKCDSCGQKHKFLHLDHDHETGRFRGWLCPGCNLAAGSLKDDVLRALMLAAYISEVTDSIPYELPLSWDAFVQAVTAASVR